MYVLCKDSVRTAQETLSTSVIKNDLLILCKAKFVGRVAESV